MIRRSSPPRRRSPLASGGPPKKRNPKRREKEFARCYHSVERVEFVKSLPCVACRYASTCSVNAHICGDGAGRKASYKKIIPLCFACHGYQHAAGIETFAVRCNVDLRAAAVMTEAKWIAHSVKLAVSENSNGYLDFR